MQVTRKSIFSMRENTREIDCTQEQLDAWQRGAPIQNVMPRLSANDREFLMTGLMPEEWDEVFPRMRTSSWRTTMTEFVHILVVNLASEETVYVVFRGNPQAAVDYVKRTLGEDEIDSWSVISDQPIAEYNS